MADPKLLRKDLDFYLTDRSRRYPKPEYTEKVPEQKPVAKPLQQNERRDIFADDEPNFFAKLHDKITGFFRKR